MRNWPQLQLLTFAHLERREARLRIDGRCAIVDHQLGGGRIGIAHVATVHSALVRALDELQAAVLQGAVLESEPEAHRRVGLCVQEPGVLVWCHLAANAGVLVDVHALADGRPIEVQLPADLLDTIAEGQRIEGRMLHVQRMAHLVQGDHRIHNQLTLIPNGALLEEVAYLIARLQEVPLLAVRILRLDGAEDLPIRLRRIQAQGSPRLIQRLHFLGLQEVLYDKVAILVELPMESINQLLLLLLLEALEAATKKRVKVRFDS